MDHAHLSSPAPFNGLRVGETLEMEPHGALCGPKRPPVLLRHFAVLRATVGLIGLILCLINIGSGAVAPLLGLWDLQPGHQHHSCRDLCHPKLLDLWRLGDATKDSYIPLFSNRPRLQRMASENLLVQEEADSPEQAERSYLEFAHVADRRFLATG